MEIWKSESSPRKQAALSVGVFLVGLVLIYLMRDYSQMVDVSNGRGCWNMLKAI